MAKNKTALATVQAMRYYKIMISRAALQTVRHIRPTKEVKAMPKGSCTLGGSGIFDWLNTYRTWDVVAEAATPRDDRLELAIH